MKKKCSKYISLLYIICLVFILFSCSTHKRVNSHKNVTKKETTLKKDESKKLKGKEKLIIEEAFEWLGTPYAFGRQDKRLATDCSGLVMRVYETINCLLPRNSAKQAEFCKPIKEHEVKPADLVFFITNSGSKINHVGIMIDKENFIHASSSKGVITSSINSDYYRKHLKCFGRVPGF